MRCAAGVAPALPSAWSSAGRSVSERAGARCARSRPCRKVDARSLEAALLVGCGYALHAPDQARDIVSVAGALAGSGEARRTVVAVRRWPGQGIAKERGAPGRRSLAGSSRTRDRFIVADPGCALELRDLSPTCWSISRCGRFRGSGRSEGLESEPALRWHDPCQLGRGLGRYDEPRAVLTRLIGRAPEEFAERRERAACSGAGGLVPVTLPEVSDEIADRRLRDTSGSGAEPSSPACGASLRRFRAHGADAVDLFTLALPSALERAGREENAIATIARLNPQGLL